MGCCASSNVKEKSNKDVIELDELGVTLDQPKKLQLVAAPVNEQPVDDGIVYANKGTAAGDIDRAVLRPDDADADATAASGDLQDLTNSVMSMLDEATQPNQGSALMTAEDDDEEDFPVSEIRTLPSILQGETITVTIKKRDGMLGLALDAVEFLDEQWVSKVHPSSGRRYVFNVDSGEKCWHKPPGEIIVIDGFFDGAPAEALVKSGELQVIVRI
jgi:hypothetical protein